MEQSILNICDLEKTYRTKTAAYQVLKKINANVEQGEFVAIMGPSGSGKTTLLNIVSGFLSPDGGQMRNPSETALRTLALSSPSHAFIRGSAFSYPMVLQWASKDFIRKVIEDCKREQAKDASSPAAREGKE